MSTESVARLAGWQEENGRVFRVIDDQFVEVSDWESAMRYGEDAPDAWNQESVVHQNAFTALCNAWDFIVREARGDSMLSGMQKGRLTTAADNLDAIRSIYERDDFPAQTELLNAFSNAHNVVNEFYATPRDERGRQAICVVNDLRVAMCVLEHGADSASGYLPIKRKHLRQDAFELMCEC